MLSLLRSTGCLKNWKAGKEKAKEAGMREAGVFEPPRTAEPFGQALGRAEFMVLWDETFREEFRECASSMLS